MFKDSVMISGKCFELFNDIIVQLEVYMGRFANGYKITITSANDGVHSEGSLHYKDKAIDIRIKDLDLKRWFLKKMLESFVCAVAERHKKFVFILHLYDGKNHLHIQHGRDNIISFDSAIGENKNVFIK